MAVAVVKTCLPDALALVARRSWCSVSVCQASCSYSHCCAWHFLPVFSSFFPSWSLGHRALCAFAPFHTRPLSFCFTLVFFPPCRHWCSLWCSPLFSPLDSFIYSRFDFRVPSALKVWLVYSGTHSLPLSCPTQPKLTPPGGLSQDGWWPWPHTDHFHWKPWHRHRFFVLAFLRWTDDYKVVLYLHPAYFWAPHPPLQLLYSWLRPVLLSLGSSIWHPCANIIYT